MAHTENSGTTGTTTPTDTGTTESDTGTSGTTEPDTSDTSARRDADARPDIAARRDADARRPGSDPGNLDVELLLSAQALDWSRDPNEENSIRYIETMNGWMDRMRPRLLPMCPSGVDFEDVRSVVLERLWCRHAHGLPREIPGTPVGALLRVIFRRAAIDLYRRGVRHRALSLDEAVAQADLVIEGDAADVAQERERAEVLAGLVERLPAKQKDVLSLRLQGLSPKEISERTGDTGSSVRMNLKRAREAIGARWETATA